MKWLGGWLSNVPSLSAPGAPRSVTGDESSPFSRELVAGRGQEAAESLRDWAGVAAEWQAWVLTVGQPGAPVQPPASRFLQLPPHPHPLARSAFSE